MIPLTGLSVLLTVSLLATVALTPFVVLLLRKYGFWNAKDNMHENPVPRDGGIAIATAFTCVGILDGFIGAKSSYQEFYSIAPSFLILLVTGLIDDRFGLRPKPKLLLQSIAVAILWLMGDRIDLFMGWKLPDLFSFILTWIWGIAILNAFNLIDGLDGLCSGNALIASAALGIMAIMMENYAVQFFAVQLIGCCIGFLFFNFHPAKLFLGDTGSLLLGFLCLVLSLRVVDGNFNLHSTVALLLVFWIPFCDEGLAVWRRKVKSLLKRSGGEITERDLKHLHYRLLQVTRRHAVTVLIIWGGMILIDVCAITVFRLRVPWFTLMVFCFLSILSLMLFARYELRYSYCLFRRLFPQKNSPKRRRVLFSGRQEP